MCGIFGASNLTPAARGVLPFLAFAMEDRGEDSWGRAGYNPVKNEIYFRKEIGKISTAWENPPDEWSAGIWHTRKASTGAITPRNAHPFVESSDDHDFNIVGIHNGIISNHTTLKSRYDRKGVEVDSEHIWIHIAKGLPLREIQGWGANAYLSHRMSTDEVRLGLFRFNSSALHVAKLPDGEYVFASEDKALSKAIWMAGIPKFEVVTIIAETKYEMDVRNPFGELEKLDKMEFGGTAYSSGTVVRHVRGNRAGYAWEGSEGYYGVGSEDDPDLAEGLIWTGSMGVAKESVAAKKAMMRILTQCQRCNGKLTSKNMVVCQNCLETYKAGPISTASILPFRYSKNTQ